MRRRTLWRRLFAALIPTGVVACSFFADGDAEVEPPRSADARVSSPPSLEVEWLPGLPGEGTLFALRIPETAAPVFASGIAGGKHLYFSRTPGGGLFSLAAVPVGAQGWVDALVVARFADGSALEWRGRAEIMASEYQRERLTVAPRFGAPPSARDLERMRADREKAASVARAAMYTPRIWTLRAALPRRSKTTSEFGVGRIFNDEFVSRHMGLDLRGWHGDTVRAAADGIAALADSSLLGGNTIRLNHGAGLVSSYSHLQKFLVETGDTARMGEPIGLVGATGRVTGPHLHFEVSYGGVAVNPRSLFRVSELLEPDYSVPPEGS